MSIFDKARQAGSFLSKNQETITSVGVPLGIIGGGILLSRLFLRQKPTLLKFHEIPETLDIESPTEPYTIAEISSLAQEARNMSPQEFAARLGVKYQKLPKSYAQMFGGAMTSLPEPILEKLFTPEMVKATRAEMKRKKLAHGTAYFDPKSPQYMSKAVGISIPAKQREAISKATIFHESAELKNMYALATKHPRVYVAGMGGKTQAPAHLASLVQEELFIRKYGDKNARKTFKKIYKKADPWFSGFDDEYNTIPGLRHGGVAEWIRNELTEFGSGYQGIKITAQDTHQQKSIKREFNIFARALEEYGVEVGTGHKRLPIPMDILTKKEVEQLGFVPVRIAIPEAGQTTPLSWRHPDVLYHLHQHDDTWVMHKDSHEASTMKMERDRRRGTGSIFSTIGHTILGLPHVVTEGIPGAYYYIKGKMTGAAPMVERIGEEISDTYYKSIEHMRETGGGWWEKFKKGFWETKVIDRIPGKDDAYNTITGLAEGGIAASRRKLTTEFGSGWRGKIREWMGWDEKEGIPEENAGINAFDGMAHGGVAAEARKENTPFGSKYDRLKAIARMLGKTEKELTESTAFKKAIASAQEAGAIGKGSFGEAKLYRTAIPGPEGPEYLPFVKKTVTSTPAAMVRDVATSFKVFEGIPIREGESRVAYAMRSVFSAKEKFMAPFASSFNLQREAKYMKALSHTETVPSAYAVTRKEMLMEYMPGQRLSELVESGGILPKRAQEALQETVEEAARKGIANLDINAGNILFDPRTGRASWIDWGMATETPVRATMEARESMSARLHRRLFQVEEPQKRGLTGPATISFSPPVLPAPAAMQGVPAQELAQTLVYKRSAQASLVKSAEALKLQQEQLANASIRGGRGHIRSSNTSSLVTADLRPKRSVSVATVKPGRNR